MDKVYFLEKIMDLYESEYQKVVTLFDASLYLESADREMSSYFFNKTISTNKLFVDFKSGFVHYYDGQIANANGSSVARHYRSQSNVFRRQLIDNSLEKVEESILSEDVYSFHVNVGHGNCSFIIDRKNNKIIAVDCSNYDYTQKNGYYQSNIDACINHIKNRFSLIEFKINYFVLTHPHFDHYSGIDNLIKNSYVDSGTIFYLNAFYSMPSPIFNRTLQNIQRLRCSIVEPVSSNSNALIEILYPYKRIVKTSSTIHNYLGPIIDPNPNNASVVLNIRANGRSFTLTGDIEKDAWDRMDLCMPHMKCCDYYAVSHHGSINGHLRTKCIANRLIKSVSDCISKTALPIVMGRSGAYPGMPSKQMIADFGNLTFSEADPKGNPARFLELEWQTGKPAWY